jgi:hypothetical protein
MYEIRKGSGPQAGDVAGDDRLHDLGGAAVDPLDPTADPKPITVESCM